MNTPRIAGSTVAATARNTADAHTLVGRLRSAGFADVRLSERTGETAEEHVSAETGLTEADFAAALERSGFAGADARELARAVAGGAVLITIAAGDRVGDASAVVRGETVAAPVLHPADAMPPAAPAQPVRDPAPAPRRGTQPGEHVVQLRAEKLDVATEAEQTEARVRREVVTEQRTVTVPVRHEELVIERDGADPVRVPLTDEETP